MSDHGIGATLDFVSGEGGGLDDEVGVGAVFFDAGGAEDDVTELLAGAHLGVEGFADEVTEHESGGTELGGGVAEDVLATEGGVVDGEFLAGEEGLTGSGGQQART